MKRSVLILSAVLFFIALGFFGWQKFLVPVNLQDKQTVVFTIQRGESLTSISSRLEQEHLIQSAASFRLLVMLKNLSRQLQAGDFHLSPSMDSREVAISLTHGTLDVRVTFPEGWRREEYADRLEKNFSSFDKKEFLAATKDLEGMLFPDTYFFPQEIDAQGVIKKLKENFGKKASIEVEKASKSNDILPSEVLILASIVEREAKGDDQPIVAGILLRRKENDWPLQADATIQYALDNKRCLNQVSCDWWQPVKKGDLSLVSPYNTYLNKGFPPAAICNPGLSSIRSVSTPTRTDYWFYLTDARGVNHYARTNEEHNQNIAKYLSP